MAIRVKADPTERISASDRAALRKRHKALYEQMDRFVNRQELGFSDFQVSRLDEAAGIDEGAMVMLVSNEDLAEIAYRQLSELYFPDDDKIPPIARIGAHRCLDRLLTGMDDQESSIASVRFEAQGDEYQIVVTRRQPYTDSVEGYVERLIFLENNAEQLIPALRPKNIRKVLEN
jgi:hypothetical protein